MQWVSENWGLLLVGGGMVAMHLFGYRRPVRGRNPRLQVILALNARSTT